MHALPGGTAVQSKQNSQQWLDNIVIRITSQDALVYTGNGIRQWGLYHRIVLDKFNNITSVLSIPSRHGADGLVDNYFTLLLLGQEA